MKPHLVSEIRKGIRDILVRRSPQVAALGYIPDGRITEEIMGVLLKYILVEHGNRGEPESELVMVEKAEWERLKALDTGASGRLVAWFDTGKDAGRPFARALETL